MSKNKDIDLLIINHIINKFQSIPDKVLGPIKINFLTYKLNSWNIAYMPFQLIHKEQISLFVPTLRVPDP